MDHPASTAGVALTTDLTREDGVPYFLWDEPMTLRTLRDRLDRSEQDRIRLLGKILREARDADVWLFSTPEEIDRRSRRKRIWGCRRPKSRSTVGTQTDNRSLSEEP